MVLWDSIHLGSLELKNRLVFLATHLGYCQEDGAVTDRLIAFYEDRARNGPGLIIVGGCYIEHLGMSGPTMIGISRNEHVEGLSRLVDTVHDHGVPAAAQLYHAGRYAHSLVLGQQAVSSSAVKCRLTRETPRPLSLDEISHTVHNYGQAALRAKRAGFDSVEILGSAGYLINQFMAKATNLREDEYGGPLESRARFALEVVRSVRKTVGKNTPVIYRISGEDFVPDGMTLEDNKQVVSWLEEAGIDALNVTGGWHETRVPQITMDVPRGGYAYLAEELAEVVDIPVIACNRINTTAHAERILQRGKVQLIGMSRGFLADSLIASKNHSHTRPCIACNIGCLDNVFMLEPVTCAINPLAGFEAERAIGASGSGSVCIVGGGPAGMEASRVLAKRGFSVTLYEEHNRLGGKLRLASRIPRRGEFAAYISYMEHELKSLGVNVILNSRITAAEVVSESFDHVIVATGTIAGSPSINGVELNQVTTAYDVLEYRQEFEGDVAIIGGRSLGCYTALYVASPQNSIRIFDEDEALGVDLGRTSRWVILKYLQEKGINAFLNTQVVEIEDSSITVKREGVYYEVDTSAVILATNPQPHNRLAIQLERLGTAPELIGSVNGSSNLLDVIHGAFQTASNL